MRIDFQVTQEDIDKGLSNACFCPVALALGRATKLLGYNRGWQVTKRKLYMGETVEQDGLNTPWPVRIFVSNFDIDKRCVSTQSFILEVPDNYLQQFGN